MSSDDVTTDDVTLPLPDGREMTGTLARPARAGRFPGVIVLHEVFGVTPEIIDVARKFAARGFVAVVPDMFSGGRRIACLARAMVESSRGKPGAMTERVEATRRWLADRSDVDADRIAVIGFCMGGGFALTFAASGAPGVRAAAVNYGPVPKKRDDLRASCPVVASYGARDLVYGSQARRLEAALDAHDIDHDVKVYDDAGHSFLTDGRHPVGRLVFLPLRLGHHESAAADAWQRIFDFFDRHLHAPATSRR